MIILIQFNFRHIFDWCMGLLRLTEQTLWNKIVSAECEFDLVRITNNSLGRSKAPVESVRRNVGGDPTPPSASHGLVFGV